MNDQTVQKLGAVGQLLTNTGLAGCSCGCLMMALLFAAAVFSAMIGGD